MIDTAVLHSRIAGSALDYLRELFGEELEAAGTDTWREGRRGSLAITIRDGVLVFYSHEDGAGGDAIALWQRQRGGTVGEALKAAAAWANVPDEATLKGKGARASSPAAVGHRRRVERAIAALGVPQSPALPSAPLPSPAERPASLPAGWEPPRMSDAESAEAFAFVKRLAGDEALCERLAKERNWKMETVRGLAAVGAMGWSDCWPRVHRGAIVFCYDSGIKHRWGQGKGKRILWYRGKPSTLWREWLLLDHHTVYVMEGEPDAISMINTGVEEDGGTLVTAVPNAGAVPYGLAEFVRGRHVKLSLDRDKAGEAATRKLARIVRPVAASVEIWKA